MTNVSHEEQETKYYYYHYLILQNKKKLSIKRKKISRENDGTEKEALASVIGIR